MNKDVSYAAMRLSLALERRLFRERLRRRAEALFAQAPVVVLGRGKSGTRLIPECLSALGVAMATRPEFTAGDVDDLVFRKVVKRMARRNLFVEGLPQVKASDLCLFQKAAFRLFRRMRGNPQIANGWGWKYPETYLIVPYVYKTFPNARFIHLVRDGRDVAFRQHLTDDPRTPLGRQILSHLDALERPPHVRAALSWQFQVEKFRRFAAQIPAGQVLELHFEDFCADPVAVLGRVAAFLDLPMTEAAAERVRAYVRPSNLSQHRQEDPDKVREVEALIHDTLAALGYGPASGHPVAAESR